MLELLFDPTLLHLSCCVSVSRAIPIALFPSAASHCQKNLLSTRSVIAVNLSDFLFSFFFSFSVHSFLAVYTLIEFLADLQSSYCLEQSTHSFPE